MTREDALGLLNSLIVMNQEIKRRETYYYCWDTGVRNILPYIRECYPEYVSDKEIVGKKLRFSKWDCEYLTLPTAKTGRFLAQRP